MYNSVQEDEKCLKTGDSKSDPNGPGATKLEGFTLHSIFQVPNATHVCPTAAGDSNNNVVLDELSAISPHYISVIETHLRGQLHAHSHLN